MTDDTKLWDALHRVRTETGLDLATIALKARVPLAPVEAFVETQADLDHDTAMRLAVFCSHALENPLGLALTMCREAAGMSHGDVMATTGLNKYSISKWERGERKPGTDALLTLHQCYRVALPDLPLSAFLHGDVPAIRAFIEGLP